MVEYGFLNEIKEKYGRYWIWDMKKQGESVPDLPTPPATRTDSV